MIKIKTLSAEDVDYLKIKNWPFWRKEISEFDWYYDSDEEFYLVEGEINITIDGTTYNVKPGDYVIMRKGLTAHWQVIKPVLKHYNYNEV